LTREHLTHYMRDTSLKAYRQLTDLGVKQREVYFVIKHASVPVTDREITVALGYGDPNKVRPRRFELARQGWIVEAGRRRCSVSGKLAITWRAVE